MNVRVFDLMAESPNGVLSPITTGYKKKDKSLYDPSNLGGGYSYNNGSISFALDTISFTLLLATDREKTAYQRYNEIVNDISNSAIVWLRYGVPLGDGQYRWAYRPCIVLNISKTEALYANSEMKETVTVQPLSEWFELYKFRPSGNVSLDPSNAINLPSMLLNTADNKSSGFVYPYLYYKELLKKSGWYDVFNKPLDENTKYKGILAIHAPSSHVSSLEKQILTIHGNNFVTDKMSPSEVTDANNVISSVRNARDMIRHRKGYPFKSRIENFNISPRSLYGLDYSSFYISGNTSAGGRIQFRALSGTLESELTFLSNGNFVIDSGNWVNRYELNGSMVGIDFKKFVNNRISSNGAISFVGSNATEIIMRRGVVGV